MPSSAVHSCTQQVYHTYPDTLEFRLAETETEFEECSMSDLTERSATRLTFAAPERGLESSVDYHACMHLRSCMQRILRSKI